MKRILEKKSVQKVKEHIKEKSFLQEGHFLYVLFTNALLIVVAFVYLLTNVRTGQSLQPIKYNYLFGIIQTGSWTTAYLLPLLLLVITVTNVFLAEYFYKRDKFLTYVFLLINFLLAGLIILQAIALNQRGM